MNNIDLKNFMLDILAFMMLSTIVFIHSLTNLSVASESNTRLLKTKIANPFVQNLEDWVISDTVVIVDSTLTLEGNLIIEEHGNLTLNNVNLVLNNPPTHEEDYKIYAFPGSKLRIIDSEIRPIQNDNQFIFFLDSTNFQISGSEIECVYWKLNHVKGAKIEDNDIKNNYRIKLIHSDSIIIHGNTFSTREFASNGDIEFFCSHYNKISNNSFSDAPSIVSCNYSWFNEFCYNEVTVTCGGAAIMLTGANGNNLIAYNTFNVVGGGQSCPPIRLHGVDFPNAIIGNTINGYKNALLIERCSNILIANNNCSNLTANFIGGLDIAYSHNCKILNNKLSSSKPSILLLGSTNNEIKGNKISDCRYGIGIYWGSQSNIIQKNTFSRNENNLIIMDSHDNQIVQNDFYKNGSSSFNVQAWDDGNNAWNANYFDDYLDIGADTLGYYPIIPDSLRDEFFGTAPYGPQDVTIPALVNVEFQDLSWLETRTYSFLEDETLENQTFEILGCWSLFDSTRVIFRNCTFLIKQGIIPFVVNAATLEIYDCEFIADGIHSSFYFEINEGAKFIIKNSKIYSYIGFGTAISLNSNNCTVENCEIVGGECAINADLANSASNTFKNNRIYNFDYGIMAGKNGNIIENNTVFNCIQSAIFIGGEENRVICNKAFNSSYGIMFNTSNSQASGNTIYDCAVGICTNTIFTNNFIYNNNFIDNGQRIGGIERCNAFIHRSNGSFQSYWYYENQGNFWSDYFDHYPYAKEHAQLSGVWDTHYEIPGIGELFVKDMYPLMCPVFKDTVINKPAKPNLSAPPNGAIDIDKNPILSWNPSPEASSYRIIVSDDTTFKKPLINQSHITNTSFTLKNLKLNTTYHWRVIAINSGFHSNWSETWNFTTLPQLPNQVRLLSPTDNSNIDADSVVFKWEKCSPAVDCYWFEFSTDSLMTDCFRDSILKDTTTILYSLENHKTYRWQVKAHNPTGWGPFSQRYCFRKIVTGVQENEKIPKEFNLSQNYPNPFNSLTTIEFAISRTCYVKLILYDILGKETEILLSKELETGKYSYKLHSDKYPSGIYFYRIQTEHFSKTKKLLLLK